MGKVTAVIGAQWGDEGKGKLVDYMCSDYDVVVRYQGGNNAGHTVYFDNKAVVLRSIPSGILNENVVCVIGHGVVISPESFLAEIDKIENLLGKSVKDRLILSSKANIVLPLHRLLDRMEENFRSVPLGTTMRGIGPAYEDFVGRRSIKIFDLFDEGMLKKKLGSLFRWHQLKLAYTSDSNAEEFSYQSTLEHLLDIKDQLLPMVGDTSFLINKFIKDGKSVLFEGAQGTMLDINFGTYPFVTSSNVTAGGISIGSGVGPLAIKEIFGVMKSYLTRVGEGWFITELKDHTGSLLCKEGNEFGSVTGRMRRCGWFDLLVAKYAARINSLTGLIITKLDILDRFDTIKVCVAYKYGSEIFYDLPDNPIVLRQCEPVYKVFDGWKCDTKGITDYKLMPLKAKEYLSFLQEQIEVPVIIISTGPDRNDICKVSL